MGTLILIIYTVVVLAILIGAAHKVKEANKIAQQAMSEKKSGEVRAGLLAEQMAPLLQEFPYPPEAAVFLGRPVDYVIFARSKVVFLEIKSGKSRLTKPQRRLRDSIKNGHVYWEELRIDTNKVSHKRT